MKQTRFHYDHAATENTAGGDLDTAAEQPAQNEETTTDAPAEGGDGETEAETE